MHFSQILLLSDKIVSKLSMGNPSSNILARNLELIICDVRKFSDELPVMKSHFLGQVVRILSTNNPAHINSHWNECSSKLRTKVLFSKKKK